MECDGQPVAIAPGMSADLITINVDRHQFSGAHHDIVAALIFCQVDTVDYSFINGKKAVDRGQLTTLELPTLVEKHNQLAHQLLAN